MVWIFKAGLMGDGSGAAAAADGCGGSGIAPPVMLRELRLSAGLLYGRTAAAAPLTHHASLRRAGCWRLWWWFAASTDERQQIATAPNPPTKKKIKESVRVAL